MLHNVPQVMANDDNSSTKSLGEGDDSRKDDEEFGEIHHREALVEN